MTAQSRLQALFDEVLREARANRAFAERLERILEPARVSSRKRPARRAAAVLDPVRTYLEGGEETLRRQLSALDLEQLKDIVAEHGMDQSRLVMKWTTTTRIQDHIITSAAGRAKKGDAFRT